MRKSRNAARLATVHTQVGLEKIIAVGLLAVIVATSVCIFALKNKENVVYGAEETSSRFNPETLQDNEHMHVELDSSGDKVPVPNGYVGSKATGENEIDTGYVIYEGTEEVNDNNVEEAQKTRNQYVWIPVPDASTMYGTDANGKKWGKLYNFATSSNNANYDEETGAYPNNWSEKNGVMSITNKGSYREPDIVKGYSSTAVFDMDSKLATLGLGAETIHDFLIQLDEKFNAMIGSVEKYGGFYIGRYETGNLSKDSAVVTRGNNDNRNQNWYTMYNKCKTLKDKNTNVETGIIWGCQWYRTLIWLIESGNKSIEEICVDSSSWGNFNGSIRTTGYNEAWKAANIYDLARKCIGEDCNG